MANRHTTLTALFTAIANSLRSKTGGTGTIKADDFPSVIEALDTDGIHPSGTKTITTNGTHDVTSFASASVNVPVGITPSGTKTITANGTHDVTSYANAQVNVPVGVFPSGTKTITTNGTHDVTNFASAQVNVPVGITPTGSKTITANGTHDVTNYASAVVNVPTPAQISVVRNITISSDLGAGTAINHTIVSGDSFVAEHYADDDFFAMLYPVTQVASATGVGHCVYHGNKNIGSSGVARYGFYYYSSSASAVAMGAATAKISGSGYNISLRARSTGDVTLYVAANRTIKAGTYVLVLTCA